MELCNAYKILNHGLVEVTKSLTLVEEVKQEDTPDYVRLEEKEFVISEESKRVGCILTAHNIDEYKNVVYSVTLENNIGSWLDILMEAGHKNE